MTAPVIGVSGVQMHAFSEIRVFALASGKYVRFRPRAETDELERRLRAYVDPSTIRSLVRKWHIIESLLKTETAKGNATVYFCPTGQIVFTEASVS